MSHEEIFGALIMLLLSVAGWFSAREFKNITKRMESVEKKADDNEDKMSKIQINYLDRFGEIKNIINDNHIKTINAINDVKISVASSQKFENKNN